MTPALPAQPRLRSRLSAWLSPVYPSEMALAPPPAARTDTAGSAEAALYAEIGEFLFTHHLPLGADTFGVVLDYLRGDDPALVAAIRDRLRGAGRLDAAFVRWLAESRSGAVRPAMVAQMADGLSMQLARCLQLLGQSCTSAQDYGSALDLEAQRMTGSDEDTIGRLIELTVQAVATSRQMAEQLDETRRETSQLRDNLDRARRVAEQDHLTGLINRRGFDARLRARAEAEAAHDPPWCVALCDIDNFKAINDRHGHDAGDRVLKLVARALKTDLGKAAVVGRHGGEEFACLFPDSSAEAAFANLDAVRESIAARSLVNRDTGEQIGALTISIGLAEVRGDPIQAMRDADTALYHAKRTGKNRVVTTTLAMG